MLALSPFSTDSRLADRGLEKKSYRGIARTAGRWLDELHGDRGCTAPFTLRDTSALPPGKERVPGRWPVVFPRADVRGRPCRKRTDGGTNLQLPDMKQTMTPSDGFHETAEEPGQDEESHRVGSLLIHASSSCSTLDGSPPPTCSSVTGPRQQKNISINHS